MFPVKRTRTATVNAAPVNAAPVNAVPVNAAPVNAPTVNAPTAKSRPGRLEGKIALVTGAGAGIGRASALLFAEEGAQVIATDMNPATLEGLKIVAGIVRTEQLNVTKKEDILNLAKTIDKVDVIFNCAGIVPGGSILEAIDAQWNLALDVNARGAFWVCQALIPTVLKNKGTCSIINLPGVASSVKADENNIIYAVSNAALLASTKLIATDFVGNGIRANNICPGTVDPPSWIGRFNSSPDVQKALADYMGSQKMGRLVTAKEIAHLALFLASDEASCITGQDFIIDGGWSM
jgi:NAD(P)-dependent dehydrogenase (short-subunit alcohol dehydrogenase family)